MAKVYGGRWETVEGIGRGGQAEVFTVKDLRNEVPGLSVLKRVINGKRRTRFVAEVTACKTLSHPNLMRVIDHSALDVDDDSNEKMYLVMPLMQEGSLEKRVALYKDSLDSALQVVTALADALEHAHGKRVIHRDVKPANILFSSPTHVPTLSDFGICLIRGEERTTEVGERVGPWDFMAPELFRGGQLQVTPSVDVYSLGKVIYYMLSGGVIVPREDHSKPEFDIFAKKGGRYLLLARLLDRMVCQLDKRIATMAEVKKELQRISTWEEKQGAAISPGATAALSAMLDSQRTALSVEEHNARVYEAEQAATGKYVGLVTKWMTEQVKALTEALTNPGLISARVLTPAEVKQSTEKCSRVQFDYGHDYADLVASHGLEIQLAAGVFLKEHRLLLNVYATRRFTITIGPRAAKREPADLGVLFAPYYFRDKHWQTFFSDPSRNQGKHRIPVLRNPASAYRDFSNDPLAVNVDAMLCHRTTIGKWPEDADAYNHVKDLAVERLLRQIQSWNQSSFATLEL